MRLEIGCGLKPHAGFKTIDVEEYAHPDYLGDFRTMSFKDIEEIRCHHLLEHFGRKEAIDVLKLWYSWLAKGGCLIIETPDFKGICEDFIKTWDLDISQRKIDKRRYWLSRHAYGSQEQTWAYHKDAWWEEKFKSILPQLGFKILGFRLDKSRAILPNILVVAEKL